VNLDRKAKLEAIKSKIDAIYQELELFRTEEADTLVTEMLDNAINDLEDLVDQLEQAMEIREEED
jgi:hypothetical protein